MTPSIYYPKSFTGPVPCSNQLENSSEFTNCKCFKNSENNVLEVDKSKSVIQTVSSAENNSCS